MSLVKIGKKEADYIHQGNGNYFCKDCSEANSGVSLCRVFGWDDVIKPIGGCIAWVEGTPKFDPSVQGFLGFSPKAMKYEENKAGFGCRRCEEFGREKWLCKKVNEAGVPDPGVIHPMGCCDEWEKDPMFGGV